MSETHAFEDSSAFESAAETPPFKPKVTVAIAPALLKPIRVLILAQVGSIGKSTIGACVLQPHLKGSFYSIESFNQDAARYGIPVKRYTADEDDLGKFQHDLTDDAGHAIVDIGQSALDEFLKRMAVDSMVQDFDYVVSVADPSLRGQDEAIELWKAAMDLGFRPDQYRLVLNRSKPTKEPEEQFARLFAYKQRTPEFWLNRLCVLPEVRAFNSTIKNGVSWDEALSPGVDWLGQSRALRAEGREPEAQEATNRAVLQKWATGAFMFTEGVWAALDIPV